MTLTIGTDDLLCRVSEPEEKGSDPLMYKRPDLSYFVVQSVLYGVMALTTRRFVFLWVPSMCVLAGAGLCDTRLWGWISRQLHLTKKVVILTILSEIANSFISYQRCVLNC